LFAKTAAVKLALKRKRCRQIESRGLDFMQEPESCGVICADKDDARAYDAESCKAKILIVESDAGKMEKRPGGKDRPAMKRRFLADSAIPTGLRKEIDDACRLLGLTRKRDQIAVARQIRLRRSYRNLYVAYLPKRNGIYVIATARPGIDDIYSKIEAAGGITCAESSKVVIDTPAPGEYGQARIWSPRVATEV
jgi:hypothetical protein